MKIELKEMTVRDLAEGYEDNEEEGVVGLFGQAGRSSAVSARVHLQGQAAGCGHRDDHAGLPPQCHVLGRAGRTETTRSSTGNSELSQFVSTLREISPSRTATSTTFRRTSRTQILDYELMVYLCSGTDSERLDWFKTINIAGEKLTDQELRNAVYAGSWVTDAKRYFSKTGCPAYSHRQRLHERDTHPPGVLGDGHQVDQRR